MTSWQDELRRAAGPAEIRAALRLTPGEEEGLRRAPFAARATPYYLGLADRDDPTCPVRRQIVPDPREAELGPGELADPLGEEERRPVAALVHRYPDRAVVLATDLCAAHCRHCNRRRLVGGGRPATRDELAAAVAYVAAHPEIRDVLLSGGDPLVLATDKLDWLLGELRRLPHVDILRVGTRAPVVLPGRVDAELAAMLRRHAPLFVNTHFNHAKELTPEAAAACARLVDAGVPVGNQAVLLRGVNSSVRSLRALHQGLLRLRVRPYYLFVGDVAAGTGHLRLSPEEAVLLHGQLRGFVSGLAVPHLMIDTPGGAGKVEIAADPVVARRPDGWLLRTHDGREVLYPSPPPGDLDCPYDAKYFAD